MPFWIGAGFMVANLSGRPLNALNRQRRLLGGTVVPAVALLAAYVIGAARAMPLVGYAWLVVAGQAMLTLLNAALSYWCARNHAPIAAIAAIATTQ